MDWTTIIPVLVGSGIALATSVSVEYLKYRQTNEAAARERENAVRQQSREGLHTLVTEIQDSLQEMILVAANMPEEPLGDEEAARLRAHFSDVTLRCIRLVSRLPDPEWRQSIKEVIRLTNQSSFPREEGAPSEEVDEAWVQATAKYEEVIDHVAEPLQKFYMLALDGTRP